MAPIHENLPDYESRLLTALAYFLGRDSEAQARACLCMYLRQAEPRIMAQVNYYAYQFSQATGQTVGGYEFLELLVHSPDLVSQALPNLGRVHASNATDVFDGHEE
ncbi:MAG: hypothetical protein HC929_09590 [Leptolyngbyaceae cyanobacterium SM2_5_2]|nr:hypothetical protein [Leptolyngbyaceae cyanobacterium SM2_5_2]